MVTMTVSWNFSNCIFPKPKEQVLELAKSIETGDMAVAARLAHSLVGANAMVEHM